RSVGPEGAVIMTGRDGQSAVADLGHGPDALTSERMQQARGDDDLTPRLEIALDLPDEVRIESGVLGKENDRCAFGEMRREVDRNADVAEIVLQEVLIGRGLVWFVALDPDRGAQLAEKPIDLGERIPRHVRPAGHGLSTRRRLE